MRIKTRATLIFCHGEEEEEGHKEENEEEEDLEEHEEEEEEDQEEHEEEEELRILVLDYISTKYIGETQPARRSQHRKSMQ